MNKIKFLQLTNLILVSFLLTGCIAGTLKTKAYTPVNQDIGVAFYVDQIKYKDNEVNDTLDKAFLQINKERISKVSSKLYPAVFFPNKNEAGIPLSISIEQHPEDLSFWTGFNVCTQAILFFPSLGIFPIYFIPEQHHKYNIKILFLSKWGEEIFETNEILVLDEKYWLGSCPWFNTFYTHNKISISNNKKILEFATPMTGLEASHLLFITPRISELVMHSILANRKNITQKILLAEVENRWGILVGYETAAALYASDDSKAWKRWLLSEEWKDKNLKTFSGKNVIKNTLEGTLENYLGNAKKNDMIFLFLSGEIYSDPERPDDVYFICADTNKNEVWSGYRLADIFASLKEARCSNIVIIMDMCRKNNTKPILSENYLRRLEPLSSWLIIANETATRDEDDIQGPLTKMIFDAQKEKADLNKDGLVTLRELIAWIKKNISSANSLNIIYPNLDSKLLEYPLSNK